MKDQIVGAQEPNHGKFRDPETTSDGSKRAKVALSNPQTLWFNTGTLCNIECENCYILSSPSNDALVYITSDEVCDYLDQIETRDWPVREIAFTGGEPFMNPQIIAILRAPLERGFDVLVLTNAMRPMMRSSMRAGLQELVSEFGDRLTLRISLDHYAPERHDTERGAGAFEKTMTGMAWLRDIGARMAVAARMEWAETEQDARRGFAELFAQRRFAIDADNPAMTVLFPEMDLGAEVPEITTECWSILDKSPDDVMCSQSRMVVKRRGAARPAVLACTLLAYEREFELGETLEEAERDVALNHPHCAKFCVLGGASCSA